jgi:phi13 family phage major tail protein
MANKVKYGLSNVYYSVMTETITGGVYSYTYDTPVPILGAVNLSLTANSEQTTFRADNIDYFVTYSNNGYEGDLEVALIPDSFKKDILGELEDTNGVVYEKNDAKPKAFALLFQFEGDDKARRHVLYNCKASRPALASQTTDTTIEPVTETLSITATGRAGDGLVKASSKWDDTTTTEYTNWFTQVYQPVI